MGSLSNFGENAFLNHLCGTSLTAPTNLYLCFCTADPGEAGTGGSMNEVPNSAGYARTEITFGVAGTPTTRRVTQDANVVFPQATGAIGPVTHWAITDSASYGAGNLWASGAFSPSFSLVNGNTPTVASGQVYVEITASSGLGFTTYFVEKMLDLIFNNTAYTQPATYIALLDQTGADADTTLTTAGKEVAGTDYARVLVNKAGGSTPKWEAVAGGVTQNADAITFPTVGSGNWSTVVGAAIVDGGTLDAGNVLAFDNTNVVDQTPLAGDVVSFIAGAFDIGIG